MATISDLIKKATGKKAAPKKAVNGYVLYNGKSNIDGKSIVAILTLKSANIKTGNMAQLWILKSNVSPVEASKKGLDKSVCGECKLRQSLGGACYVNLGQAPNSIYNAFKKGSYPNLPLEQYGKLSGLKIRFGAYGDPYAVPVEILSKLKAVCSNNTSYTHQWELSNDEVLMNTSMASVDNVEQQKKAVANGWRTFRVARMDEELLRDEILCPNVTSGVKCIDCNLCSGNNISAKNIVVPVHGFRKNKF